MASTISNTQTSTPFTQESGIYGMSTLQISKRLRAAGGHLRSPSQYRTRSIYSSSLGLSFPSHPNPGHIDYPWR